MLSHWIIIMKANIQKWGNSLAVRIPKAFADEAGLNEGRPVDLKLVNGQIIITSVEPAAYSLDDLLAQVTEANRHDETDTGAAQGNEGW